MKTLAPSDIREEFVRNKGTRLEGLRAAVRIATAVLAGATSSLAQSNSADALRSQYKEAVRQAEYFENQAQQQEAAIEGVESQQREILAGINKRNQDPRLSPKAKSDLEAKDRKLLQELGSRRMIMSSPVKARQTAEMYRIKSRNIQKQIGEVGGSATSDVGTILKQKSQDLDRQ